VQQPRQDRDRILADVAGLGERRDVDHRRRQPQQLAEQRLDQERLARAGRPGQEVVGLARQLVAIGALEVDALDPPHVAIRHQAQRAPRLLLPAVAVVLELLPQQARPGIRQLAHHLQEVLETLLPRPPVGLGHRWH
jgi:hypothetical protein